MMSSGFQGSAFVGSFASSACAVLRTGNTSAAESVSAAKRETARVECRIRASFVKISLLNGIKLACARNGQQRKSIVELTRIENALLCLARGKRPIDACRKTHLHKRDFPILPR